MSRTLRNALRWYLSQFQVNPYKTNCLTYGVMYMLVELLQQKFLHNYTDYRKVFERGSLGIVIQGPIVTTWFKFLEQQFPGNSTSAIVKKIVFTQGIMAPVTNFSFFVALGVLERTPGVLDEAIKKVPIAYLGGILFWIPVTIINFIFVPKFYRILYNCIFGFFWTNVMFYLKSRGYDPAKIKTDEEKRKMERLNKRRKK